MAVLTLLKGLMVVLLLLYPLPMPVSVLLGFEVKRGRRGEGSVDNAFWTAEFLSTTLNA